MSGFKHFFVENSYDLEEQILNGIQKHKHNVLVLSIVQYINGTLIDLEFIKKIKSLFPNLLIISDGTQYCGTKEFDFNNSKIDILISSCYKWLLVGYGNSFIILRNNLIKDFLNNNKISLNQILEPGHYDTLNFGSLLFSLKKISEYGLSNIEKSINELSFYAKKKFIYIGLLDDQTSKRVNHSNIFNLKGDNLLYNNLIENKVICSLRGGGIRISLNFYNKKEEVDYLLTFFK
jgi:selenocysteine lyase/cysteine desulfurase